MPQSKTRDNNRETLQNEKGSKTDIFFAHAFLHFLSIFCIFRLRFRDFLYFLQIRKQSTPAKMKQQKIQKQPPQQMKQSRQWMLRYIDCVTWSIFRPQFLQLVVALQEQVTDNWLCLDRTDRTNCRSYLRLRNIPKHTALTFIQ